MDGLFEYEMSVIEKFNLNTVRLEGYIIQPSYYRNQSKPFETVKTHVEKLIDDRFKMAASYAALSIDQMVEIQEWYEIMKKSSCFVCIRHIDNSIFALRGAYHMIKLDCCISELVAACVLCRDSSLIPDSYVRSCAEFGCSDYCPPEQLKFIVFKDADESNRFRQDIPAQREKYKQEQEAKKNKSKVQEAEAEIEAKASTSIEQPPSYEDVVPSAPPMYEKE